MTRPMLLALALAARFLLAGPAMGQVPTPSLPQMGESKSVNYKDVDCTGLELKVARGVMPAGPKHEYEFTGTCRLMDVTKTTKAGIFTTQSTTVTPQKVEVVQAGAKAEWTAAGGVLVEHVVIHGSQYSGVVSMSLRCGKDPILTKVACQQVSYKNGTGFEGFDQAWLWKRPYTSAEPFELVDASKAGASNGPKPALPPAPTPTPVNAGGRATPSTHPVTPGTWPSPAPAPSYPVPSRGTVPQAAGGAATVPNPASGPVRGAAPAVATPQGAAAVNPPSAPQPAVAASGPVMIEAEALAVRVSQGQAGQQGMTAFGRGWGGEAQLFWPVTAVGARMEVQVSIPHAGRYQVFLVHTTAPDYGIVDASFDGNPAVSINGFGSAVGRSRVSMGNFELRAGPHHLLLVVQGKDSRSRGFFVGVDQVQLFPY